MGCPDGIAQGQKAIEIKCPFKFTYLDIKISELKRAFNFNLILFMTLKNNKPTLKLNHQYQTQCQDIMVITELKTIDFVV